MGEVARRPALEGGMEARDLTAMRVAWSQKDTTTFRRRVKQIEGVKRPAAGDGARAPDGGLLRL